MKGNFHVRFLGEGAAATPLPYPTKFRRFDWPPFLRASETGQTKRLSRTYAVTHSTSIPEPTLHCAVVRSCHSRPAPFRSRFQEHSLSAHGIQPEASRSAIAASNESFVTVARIQYGLMSEKDFVS